ncbi:MAG: succinate dehydrogenase assembly factor 2 [Gammaproteobacteria bacterium]|nr:succinate dehydrogenase assembly factor 2 [Gammaproteobacteria bacterium]
MNTDNRLRWRCRRGLLELDLVLQGFLDGGWGRLAREERILFGRLLTEADADLWQWIQGAPAPIEYEGILMLLRHVACPTSNQETIGNHD